MVIRENIKEALRSLLGAKQRSILALLGIVIGIGSVIAMVSIGTIVQNEALRQFKEMGTDILQASPTSSGRDSKQDKNEFSLQTVMDIPYECDLITLSTPQTSHYGKLQYSGDNLDIPALGVSESARELFKIDLVRGRFISDLDKNMYFCVIGAKVHRFLRQNGMNDPLGKRILFNKEYFRIVGVAEEMTMNSMRPYQINEGIIIPVSTSFRFPKAPKIESITVRVASDGEVQKAETQLQEYLQDHDRVKTRVRSAEELIDRMQKQMRMFTLLLGAIGSISLIVGGVGVMNVMLVSVTERKREIGIRRALGARRADIQAQFLIESLILCFVGGMIGIALGVGASYLISRLSDWHFLVSLPAVFLGVGVSVVIGLFFGFYPARQAANMSPIEALREE
ncbi:MAG: ABC transporter permease [Desulfonatronovibrionaceae bacterium]